MAHHQNSYHQHQHPKQPPRSSLQEEQLQAMYDPPDANHDDDANLSSYATTQDTSSKNDSVQHSKTASYASSSNSISHAANPYGDMRPLTHTMKQKRPQSHMMCMSKRHHHGVAATTATAEEEKRPKKEKVPPRPDLYQTVLLKHQGERVGASGTASFAAAARARNVGLGTSSQRNDTGGMNKPPKKKHTM
jgi:hypothetical protein